MPPTGDLRRVNRVRLSGKVRLFWEESYTAQQATAEIHDVSETGLSCWMPRRLAPGTRVKIEASHLKLFGFATVRHSRGQGMKILVGMQFDGDVHWMAGDSAPARPRWT